MYLLLKLWLCLSSCLSASIQFWGASICLRPLLYFQHQFYWFSFLEALSNTQFGRNFQLVCCNLAIYRLRLPMHWHKGLFCTKSAQKLLCTGLSIASSQYAISHRDHSRAGRYELFDNRASPGAFAAAGSWLSLEQHWSWKFGLSSYFGNQSMRRFLHHQSCDRSHAQNLAQGIHQESWAASPRSHWHQTLQVENYDTRGRGACGRQLSAQTQFDRGLPVFDHTFDANHHEPGCPLYHDSAAAEEAIQLQTDHTWNIEWYF